MEILERGVTSNVIPFGTLSPILPDGTVTGWAVDFNATSTSLKVDIYADGAPGVGTFVTQVTANQPNLFLKYPGNHQFTLSLPANLRDKLPHKLYAFAIDTDGGPTGTLTGTNQGYQNFQIYPTSAAGLTYWTNNVKPKLNTTCAGCHAGAPFLSNYTSSFYNYMGSPTPAQGGTATNNFIYNKASGISHGGGNQCGGGACTALSGWWSTEFP